MGMKRHGLHDPKLPAHVEEAEHYITLLEELLQKAETLPAGAPVRIPGITCPRCSQPVDANYEGERYLWFRQPRLHGAGINPADYCSFPYYLAERFLKRHPDWKGRLVSGCNRCHEELNLCVRHECARK